MYIQTEETPNPNALKFLPGCHISVEGPVFFNTPEETIGVSDLAALLYNIDGVEAVFFGFDFITVTKNPNYQWELIKPELIISITDHLLAGLPVFCEKNTNYSNINLENLSEIEKQIVEIIETRVRPSVAMDGGDIIYEGFCDGIVYLKMRGACSGCPSSTVTLKSGIESMLQHFIPEVKAVEAVED